MITFRFIRIALLPSHTPPSSSFCTKSVKDLRKPVFGDVFNFSIPSNKIYTKTLQINVLSKAENQQEKCIVSTNYMFIFVAKFYTLNIFLDMNLFLFCCESPLRV